MTDQDKLERAEAALAIYEDFLQHFCTIADVSDTDNVKTVGVNIDGNPVGLTERVRPLWDAVCIAMDVRKGLYP